MKKMKYLKIRNQNYLTHKKFLKEFNIVFNEWYKSPYSCFKQIFFLEVSSIVVFFIQHLNFSPNLITFLYALSSILALYFVASGESTLILCGLAIFFLNGILDWVDGLYARIKIKTSFVGELVDHWSGNIYNYSFIAAYAFYLFNKSSDILYMNCLLIILFLRTIDIKIIYNQKIVDKVKKFKILSLVKKKTKKKKLKLSKKVALIISSFIKNLFDDRARSVDFLSLLILIDLYFFDVIFLKYIFLFIFLKYFLIFFSKVYLLLKNNYL